MAWNLLKTTDVSKTPASLGLGEAGQEILHNRKLEKNNTLVVHDILSKRFNKVIKEKKLDITKFARELGGFWFTPAARRKIHPDGTYDEIPINRLKLFLDNKSTFYIDKGEFERLEKRLGYEENVILTNYLPGITQTEFLKALDYLTEAGKPTSKYLTSPRIVLMRKQKAREDKELRDRQKAYQKLLAKKKPKSVLRIERLKKVLTGIWGED